MTEPRDKTAKRKRAEEAEQALQDSEGQFRDVLKVSRDLIYRLNLQTRTYEYVSPSVRRLVGFAPQEIVAMGLEGVRERFHPEDRERLGTHPSRLPDDTVEGREAPTIEYRWQCKDGEYRWLSDNRAFVLDEDGRALALVGNVRDITEAMAADEALRESEEKYRILAESSPEMIYLIDARGIIRYVNPAGLAMFKGGTEAVIGKHLRDFYPPAVAEHHLTAIRAIIKSGRPISNELLEEFPIGKRWIDARLSPVKDGTGAVVGVLGLSTDITERVNARKALAESEEKFRAIIEQNSEGIILIDEQCLVIEWNPAMERMTGITASKAKGRPVWEVLGMTALPERWTEQRAEQMKKMFLGAVKAGWSPLFNAPIEAVLVRNGEQVYIQQAIFPIKTEKGYRLGSITRDVTERKKMEERMARDEKLESLQVFAGGIAHDFNNLLAGIFGNIDLARVELPDDNPAQRYLNNAFMAFGRAKHLAQQLLTFAKGGVPQKRPLRLSELVTNACALALSGSNVKAEYRFASGLWPVEADENQVSQVFSNLIINAWQAMPQGGTVTVAAENRTMEAGAAGGLPGGNYVGVTVEDRGIGIPATIIDKIFDPFFTTKQQGSGLGLATSYSIISRHGGSIEVQSEPGKGTVFTVLLPATEKAVPEGDSDAPPPDLRGSGRILVMDDEGLIRRIVYDMLSMAGYEVTTAPEGREAVHKYREAFDIGKRFDAVILDLTVPGGMGGREAMREILKIDAGALAIVSSGYSDDAVMADYAEYGFAARVPKPYSLKDLLTTVKRVLEGRKK
jgi:PAS domain S-box-containing protein